MGQVDNSKLWGDASFKAICERHNKSQAQVMLNWAVARGTIPVPRSGTPSHIQENINIYDFVLSADEMQTIDRLEQGTRICDKRDFSGFYNLFV